MCSHTGISGMCMRILHVYIYIYCTCTYLHCVPIMLCTVIYNTCADLEQRLPFSNRAEWYWIYYTVYVCVWICGIVYGKYSISRILWRTTHRIDGRTSQQDPPTIYGQNAYVPWAIVLSWSLMVNKIQAAVVPLCWLNPAGCLCSTSSP